jgi:glutathione synthase/RimK-type ligase-like ATP-grasp enzyme
LKKVKLELIPFADSAPTSVYALPALMRMTPPELQALLVEIHQDESPARTSMQMALVFMLNNQHEAAMQMQARALQHQRHYRIANARATTLRLLVVMGPGNMQDNTPIEFVLDDCDIQTEILYLLPGEAFPDALPQHDVAFVAVGESDKNATLLMQLESQMPRWPRPVVNKPHAIRHCARDTCYALLKSIPDVCIAKTQRWQFGDALEMDYPITLRPVDTQGGEGLRRINGPTELTNYFAEHPAQAYYAAQYVDYQSADGLYRKLRIVLIDGAPYVCHMAISSHWMVHYLSAGMAESAEKRQEEQHMMEGFDQDFAHRYGEPLRAIAHALQLDYVTIDCAEGPEGKLLVFEADSRGIIHAADPVHIYPYKPAVMQKAFDAFAALLRKRAETK